MVKIRVVQFLRTAAQSLLSRHSFLLCFWLMAKLAADAPVCLDVDPAWV